LDPSRFFNLIRSLRRYSDIPLGILMYANIAHHIGYASFCKRAAQAGIDSILVADMPPEEAGEMLEAMEWHGLGSVFIVSELTPGPRMKYICDATTGFVYVVSRLGTTGVQSDMDASVNDTLARLHGVTAKPLCVGFGISRPEHVARVKQAGAQGAIVGSALVKIIESEAGNTRKMLLSLKRQVQAFKEATRQ
jgi:tryptophan synthase alpha chain